MDKRGMGFFGKALLALLIFIGFMVLWVGTCAFGMGVGYSMSVNGERANNVFLMVLAYIIIVLGFVGIPILTIIYFRRRVKREKAGSREVQKVLGYSNPDSNSKMKQFWIGFAISFSLLFIGNPLFMILLLPVITLNNSGILSAVLVGLIILGAILFLIKNYRTRYYALGAFVAVGSIVIFLGTCFSGAVISSSLGDEFGIGGAILALPVALGLAVWFLIAVTIKISQTSKQTEKINPEIWK